MNLENYISLTNLCTHYKVTPSFFFQIREHELIQIETFNNEEYLALDAMNELEQMIRLYHDLQVHEENIDIVYNLIKKIENLQHELRETKKQLNGFQFETEND